MSKQALVKGGDLWYQLREKYVKSLWHFCYEILGFRDIDNDFHREELARYDEYISKGETETLTLWPRGHLKSHCLTIGDSLRRICMDTSIRILILNATGNNAKQFLKVISEHIMGNKRLHFFFPEVKPHVDASGKTKWTQDEITVDRRSPKPEPTVKALGIDSNIVSQHFDVIKYDDIVTWDNSDAPEKIEVLKDKFQYSVAVLEPDGHQDVIGTRYDFYDLYNDLLNNEFFVSSVRQLKEFNKETGKEEYIFPQKFNEKVEARIRAKTKRFFIFSCQYYNSPVESDKKLFRKKMIQYYEILPPGGVFRITVDPASSTESYADRSAIVCAYWIGAQESYPFGAVFLHRYVYEHLDTAALMDEMFGMYSEIRPEFLSVEIQGSQSGTLWDVICAQKDERNFVDMDLLRFTPPSKVSKYGRIAQMQPHFNKGQIFIKEEHEEFEQELLKYTGYKKKEKDDLIDAFSQQFQVGQFPPGADEMEDDDEDDYRPLYGRRSATKY